MSHILERRVTALEAVLGTDTAAQLAFLAGVTAGTALASKALVLDGSKGISTITSATITTLTGTTANVTTVNATTLAATTHNVGASGTAGTLNVYPTTASKGNLAVTISDQTGNTAVGLNFAAMGQATVLTVQDPGASTANLITSKGVGATLGAICSATISAVTGTTGTTLTNVTGMSVALLPGTYAVEVYLQTISTANSGLKLALAYSGMTTSCVYTGDQANGTTHGAHTTTTTMGNAVAAATAVTTDATIAGTVVVSTAGNLTVQFAQNAAHADTTSVFINSNIVVQRIA